MAQPRAEIAEGGAGEVGQRLRAARAKAGLTRRQLATLSATSERYLAHIEAGTANPTVGVLAALAGALELAVADLLPLGGERSAIRAEAAAALRRLPEVRLPAVLETLQQPAPYDQSKARRLVLVGLRGAGKSSLGTALAERLGVPFIELSKEVERAYGGEMRFLIEFGGPGALRRYEHKAWEEVVARHEAAVIATPGGIVADTGLYDRILQSAHSVWLEASPDEHMSRVMAQGDFRPMASNRNAMDDLKAILAARSPDYARAEARLDTSAQDFDATVDCLERLAVELLK
ncbi:shikimate kinase [Sphingomonas sp.]|uniref:shikimate kinase n=1 Tax=Sphingomonas sp. TaxID=28214 RepID=UPI002FC9DF29